MPTIKQQRVTISYPRSQRYFLIPNYLVDRFYGLNTITTDLRKVPDGFSPDSLNWYTGDANDCIILRRGYHLLGKTRQTGAGGIKGLGMIGKADGTQIPFFATSDGRIKYYDSVSADVVEVGSQIIPTAARSDIISIAGYQNLAGFFCYLSSPNWDIVKIPAANPGSYIAQLSNNYKGQITFGQSRAFLWNKLDANGYADKTNLYQSFSDAVSLNNTATSYTYTGDTAVGTNTILNMSSITGLAAGMAVVGTGLPAGCTVLSAVSTTVTLSHNAIATGSTVSFTFSTLPFPFAATTNESVGSSGSTTYSHTLANVTGVKTCFKVIVKATVGAGTETFQDDQNGKLTSNFGGTGTINYATGALSVTFSAVTTGAVTVNYYTEDATSGGVVNFANTTASGAHVAGSGNFFSQMDGGNLNAVFPLGGVFYSFHAQKTWQTSLASDDSSQSNLPFRDKMGVPTSMGAIGTPLGVFYVNTANSSRPEIYVLKIHTGATQANIADAKLISELLNLASCSFNYAAVFYWGIYVLVACAQVVNGTANAFNSRTFLYNTKNGAWDLLDYPTSMFQDYAGTLLSGDPLTDNVFQLFSGFDDDGGIPPNYWTSGYTNFGVQGQKTTKRMVINGLIQSSQNIKVSIAYDGGSFVELFRILGTGSYVDTSKSIDVGSYTLGSKDVGGGARVLANPFEVEFNVSSDRYEYVRVRFEAGVKSSDTDQNAQVGGGYAQINWYEFRASKFKAQRSPNSRIAS